MKCVSYMKRILVIIFALSSSVFAYSQSVQEKYISTYAEIAVQEMYRSGIPASITLAQGMLESGNGRSELALKSNNHFGIKCHSNWNGARVFHDDDAKGECFRKYDHPHQSYRDHSDFLRYRDRYKFLFELKPTDYKGWAYGLKKAGYATDPSYPTKLIRLIEDYRLYQYDTKTASFGAAGKAGDKHSGTRKPTTAAIVERPAPPSVIEQAVPVAEPARKKYFQFETARQMYSKNGVPFIYSSEGETYQSIANKYGLFVKELLKFNDLTEGSELRPGTVVYLQSKKKAAVKGLEMHVVESGETFRDIAQRYAVKMDKLYKLNDWSKGHEPKEGDCIKLRK